MKISKRQLRRIIKEEKARILKEQDDGHLYPRVMWTNVEELTDKWSSAEYDSFDESDPSMMAMGDSATEARKRWNDQIEGAAMDMEAEMTARIRKVALQTMKEFSQKLEFYHYVAKNWKISGSDIALILAKKIVATIFLQVFFLNSKRQCLDSKSFHNNLIHEGYV